MYLKEISISSKKFKTHAFLAFMIFVYVFGTSSCMNEEPKDAQFAAVKHNEAEHENKSISEKDFDAQFLVLAAKFNRENIILGQLAQQRGNLIYAQDLGTLIENEHTSSFITLSSLANRKYISLPNSLTEKGRDAYKKLNGKAGKDFGQTYSNQLVKGHQDAIALFETATAKSSDPEIRAWAAATLPGLRACLDISYICQKEFEKM